MTKIPPAPASSVGSVLWKARNLWLTLLSMIAFIPLVGGVIVGMQAPEIEREAYANLQAVAQLKAAQIENWLDERQSDALTFSGSRDFVRQALDLQKKDGARSKSDTAARFAAVMHAYSYAAIELLDPQGRVLLAVGESHERSGMTPLLQRALASGKMQRSELLRDAGGGAHLDFAMPLFDEGERAVGAVLLHADPQRFLYPLIQSQPSASASFETLLVRRDGDDVVFLNELRHSKATASALKFPSNDRQLPAAVAVNDAQPGLVRGQDYRGVEVFAAYRPIAGTTWRIVAKIDRDEVMAPLWRLLIAVVAIAVAAILAIALAMRLLWRQQWRIHGLEMESQMAAAIAESEARFRSLFEQAAVGVAQVDSASGRCVRSNRKFAEIVGYTVDEMPSLDLTTITHPDDFVEYRQYLERLKAGELQEFSLEKRYIRKDGGIVWVLLTISPQHIVDASTEYYIAVVQDIGKRKTVEEKLQQLTRIYAALSQCNQAIVRCTDEQQLFPQICRDAVNFGGMRMAWIGLVDEQTQEVAPAAHFGDGTMQYLQDFEISVDPGSRFGQGPTAIAIRTDSPIWTQDFMSDPRTAPWRAHGANLGLGSSASLPLHRQGRVAGVFNVYAAEKNAFDETVVNLLTEMAMDISFALDNFAGEAKRREAEAALRDSDEVYRSILATTCDGYWRVDSHGKLLEVNDTYIRQSGYSREELLTMHIGDFEAKESAAEVGVHIQRVIEQGGDQFESVHRRKDGSTWHVEISVSYRDLNGGQFFAFLRDISERRQSEHALRESRERFDLAVRGSSDGIWDWNVRSGDVYFSERWCELLGYTQDEMHGHFDDWASLLHPDDRDATLDRMRRHLEQRKPYMVEYRLRKKSEEYGWFMARGQAQWNEHGQALRMAGSLTDIAEFKRIQNRLQEQNEHLDELVKQRTVALTQALEAAQLADRAKDQFLATVSHELRTPLNAVVGMSDLARRLSADAKQIDYLDKVIDAGKILSHRINDLLDLSKIVAGRMEFENITFSLRKMVERSSSVMTYKAAEKGLQFIEQIGDRVPDTLVGDPMRVEQILINLFGNAIKFTKTGWVGLRINLLEQIERRVCLEIEVEDTGIGLREEDLERLFKPFSQVDSSMNRKYGGTGLGLSICRQLAQMMGGDISVNSRLGRGSTFRVTLWLGLGDEKDLPAIVANYDESVMAVRYVDVYVLVVEDQPFNREIVEALLSVVGIKPHVVTNGMEALEVLNDVGPKAFDLILMDIQMPIMDGLTATRELRARPEFADVPIVAMTAHTMAHEIEISAAAGMNDHIGKPFDNADFYRILTKWISKDKQQIEAPPKTAVQATNKPPKIEEIDMEAGLSRFLGNDVRYRFWLMNFIEDTPAIMVELRRLLADGQADEARRILHSLKGKMGTLGMGILHAESAALEDALKRGESIDERIGALEQAIAHMSDKLRQALNLTPKPDRA